MHTHIYIYVPLQESKKYVLWLPNSKDINSVSDMDMTMQVINKAWLHYLTELGLL